MESEIRSAARHDAGGGKPWEARMARFVVDLGDIPLSDEEQNGIASAIHTAVIGHLATISNPGVHAATKTLNHAGMGFAPPSQPGTPKKPAKAALSAKPARRRTARTTG
jgi:hypothetical protein